MRLHRRRKKIADRYPAQVEKDRIKTPIGRFSGPIYRAVFGIGALSKETTQKGASTYTFRTIFDLKLLSEALGCNCDAIATVQVREDLTGRVVGEWRPVT
jgi:hypothetical protein